ncbi:MAG: hypothetical protein ACREFN_15085 [Acetobacteraceae bacterium]
MADQGPLASITTCVQPSDASHADKASRSLVMVGAGVASSCCAPGARALLAMTF